MLQIMVALVIYMVLVIPMGTYLYHITTGRKTFADPVFDRIDNGIYRICKIDRQEMCIRDRFQAGSRSSD